MSGRETFASRFGTLMTLIGVALGLGNIWRFPYMTGKFGGAAFVLFYLAVVVAIGVPALMAEFALGRSTRRGTVGAFALGGFPAGRLVGWFFFAIVIAAAGYYSAVVGWVVYHAVGQLVALVGVQLDSSAILPPATGFNATSLGLQLLCTGIVILGCALVMLKGLRAGIERASKVIMPTLVGVLLILMIRSLTLPGAAEGVQWFVLKFRVADLTPAVMVAAIGHAVFSLSLGGTFMVVYGSYLSDGEPLRRTAIGTVAGDTVTSLMAGFAILPAVFALGLEPGQGPGLIFNTLPRVFAAIPLGALFGALFFLGLAGAGYLSNVAAIEVLVAGVTDNTRLSRSRAVWLMATTVFLVSIPPSINNAIFIPWDLTFGSGMQTLGALMAVITVGWCFSRGAALEELSKGDNREIPRWLYQWIRFGIPLAIGAVGVWWLLTSVLGLFTAV